MLQAVRVLVLNSLGSERDSESASTATMNLEQASGLLIYAYCPNETYDEIAQFCRQSPCRQSPARGTRGRSHERLGCQLAPKITTTTGSNSCMCTTCAYVVQECTSLASISTGVHQHVRSAVWRRWCVESLLMFHAAGHADPIASSLIAKDPGLPYDVAAKVLLIHTPTYLTLRPLPTLLLWDAYAAIKWSARQQGSFEAMCRLVSIRTSG